MIDEKRYDLNELPTSHPSYAGALRRTPAEAPAVANVGHPRMLYGINSNRSRFQIIAHDCGCSPYLCEICNPRRKLVAAVRDVSAIRDLPIWVWDDLLLPQTNVVPFRRCARASR